MTDFNRINKSHHIGFLPNNILQCQSTSHIELIYFVPIISNIVALIYEMLTHFLSFGFCLGKSKVM